MKSHESLGFAFTGFHVIHMGFHVTSHVKSHDFSCEPRCFLGVLHTKSSLFTHDFSKFFHVKIAEKSCEEPRKIMRAHTKNRLILHEKLDENSCESHENSRRPTRDIRVIAHEKSRKLQFSLVSLFNLKNACSHMIFYVISHDKSSTEIF